MRGGPAPQSHHHLAALTVAKKSSDREASLGLSTAVADQTSPRTQGRELLELHHQRQPPSHHRAQRE